MGINLITSINHHQHQPSTSASTEASSSASTEAASTIIPEEGCIRVRNCRITPRGTTCSKKAKDNEILIHQYSEDRAFCCTLNADIGEGKWWRPVVTWVVDYVTEDDD